MALAVVLGGCGDDGGPGSGGVDTGPGADTDGDSFDGVLTMDTRRVDVLLVIEDAPETAAAQAELARRAHLLVETLERDGIDYRIAVTTTSVSTGPCAGAASPAEDGRYVATSCRDRLDELTTGDGEDLGATCLDVCPDTGWQIVPTTTHGDPDPVTRPWLQRIEGETNVQGASVAEALACLLPQGVGGCELSAPLAAADLATRLALGEGPERDFFREDAMAAIVILTDGDDCSFSDRWSSVSDLGAFWTPPDDSTPSLGAACWHAGASCMHASGVGDFGHCNPGDHGPDGALTDDPAAAVLVPGETLSEHFARREVQMQEVVPRTTFLVFGIAGVPEAFPDEEIPYGLQSFAPDGFEAGHGVSPGCTGPLGEAAPPVRLRDGVGHFSLDEHPALLSMCVADYSDHVQRIADAISNEVFPTCIPMCVADSDPSTPAVDAQCEVRRWVGTDPDTETPIAPCSDGPPDPSTVCYELLYGDARTPACAEEGWNLELKVVRPEGATRPPLERFRAVCEPSQVRNADCPDLPD